MKRQTIHLRDREYDFMKNLLRGSLGYMSLSLPTLDAFLFTNPVTGYELCVYRKKATGKEETCTQ